MASTTGENEKQMLSAMVQERLIGKKNSVLYKELLEEKIPTFLKNYLQKAVKKIIQHEEPIQFKHSKKFDFENSEISKLKLSLLKALEDVTVFPREELVKIIDQTVSLQFDYLVKPKQTLLNIFYKKKSDCVKSDILPVLEGLEDNRFFIVRLIDNIKKFDQYHIVKEDFKKVLRKTEKEVYQENFLNAFISEVKKFTEFLGMIRGYNSQKINIDLIKILLEERSLNQYIAAFDHLNNDAIDIERLTNTLGEFLEKGELNNQQMENDDIDNFLTHSNLEIVNSGKKENTAFPDERITVVPDKKNNNKSTINNYKDPFDIVIDRSQIERQPEGPIESLSILIDDKNERFLIKRIFNNHQSEYDKFIGKLEAIESWKKAKEVIDRELNMRSIKPFSKEALRLGDLVFNRYFPENLA